MARREAGAGPRKPQSKGIPKAVKMGAAPPMAAAHRARQTLRSGAQNAERKGGAEVSIFT
jgi:hypothetical protein